ncbi:hypothetical protein ES705_11599 [subsurface metagenome]
MFQIIKSSSKIEFMAKIIQVINTMIVNADKISNVISSDQEYFFLYDNEYKWSMSKGKDEEDEYLLLFYPNPNDTIDDILIVQDWINYPFTSYKVSDFKTTEALESFRELFGLLKGKVFGVDDIFDDIIKGQ